MVQLQMIQKVKQVALDTEAVSAVLMYGSFIKGEGDMYSDIEFYIFLRDEKGFNKEQWIGGIAPFDLFFTNEFGTDVAVFSNLIRGEFHFHPVDDVEVVHTWQGMTTFEFIDQMNLVDKDGRLGEVLSSIQPPYRPVYDTPEQREWIAQQLINNLIFVMNLLKRSEYAHAHNLFWFIQRFLLWLIRLHTSATVHWEAPTKKLENDLPAEWLERYRQCAPALDKKKLKTSFSKSLILSRELFEKLDIPQNIKDVLTKIEHESSDFG